jgi:hypothetical protein
MDRPDIRALTDGRLGELSDSAKGELNALQRIAAERGDVSGRPAPVAPATRRRG